MVQSNAVIAPRQTRMRMGSCYTEADSSPLSVAWETRIGSIFYHSLFERVWVALGYGGSHRLVVLRLDDEESERGVRRPELAVEVSEAVMDHLAVLREGGVVIGVVVEDVVSFDDLVLSALDGRLDRRDRPRPLDDLSRPFQTYPDYT